MSDLIEREAVFDAMCDNCKFETDLERYMHCSTCKDVEMIRAIPSARPNEGKWILNTDGNYECSECHIAIRGNDKPIYPFCAWCGADMRTKDEPQTEYERASEQREHDILYEPTYNEDDGSM